MTIEFGKLEGDVLIDDALTLHGMITGDATVADGGMLELYGMCCNDLILESGGTVILYGTVSGSVYNRGGYLDVHGMIVGNLHEEGGETTVQENASISGRTV
jgi:hypothetical protein